MQLAGYRCAPRLEEGRPAFAREGTGRSMSKERPSTGSGRGRLLAYPASFGYPVCLHSL